MIYTVTFNPSLDYIVSVDSFKLGQTNRTSYEKILPGGKGINVSLVLQNLGCSSLALGFMAGFTGDEIQRLLQAAGCHTDFIQIPEGMSRINLKLSSIEGTEINGSGPNISEEALDALIKKLDEMLKPGDVLVLAGSIPSSIPDSIYMDIMAMLEDRQILIAVDATRELLVNVLPYKPFIVKPNNHELGEIFNAVLHTREEVVPYAKQLIERGAQNVLVSMAGEGAVLVCGNGEIYSSPAPKGRLINGVGAGDSMVAGFLYGWLEKKSYEYAFHMGVSAGSASAFSEFLASREEIEKVYKQIQEGIK